MWESVAETLVGVPIPAKSGRRGAELVAWVGLRFVCLGTATGTCPITRLTRSHSRLDGVMWLYALYNEVERCSTRRLQYAAGVAHEGKAPSAQRGDSALVCLSQLRSGPKPNTRGAQTGISRRMPLLLRTNLAGMVAAGPLGRSQPFPIFRPYPKDDDASLGCSTTRRLYSRSPCDVSCSKSDFLYHPAKVRSPETEHNYSLSAINGPQARPIESGGEFHGLRGARSLEHNSIS